MPTNNDVDFGSAACSAAAVRRLCPVLGGLFSRESADSPGPMVFIAVMSRAVWRKRRGRHRARTRLLGRETGARGH